MEGWRKGETKGVWAAEALPRLDVDLVQFAAQDTTLLCQFLLFRYHHFTPDEVYLLLTSPVLKLNACILCEYLIASHPLYRKTKHY